MLCFGILAQGIWDLSSPNRDPVPGARPTPALEGEVLTTGCCYCSVAKSCLTLCRPWTAAHQASLSLTISWSLLKVMSIESVKPSNHPICCHTLLLLPSIFPSIRVYSNESALCTRWLKYWSFSFSISPFQWISRLISFRIDWFDLLTAQGTFKSLL